MVKIFEFCKRASDLGLNSSSTSQEIYDMLTPCVENFCEEMGLDVLNGAFDVSESVKAAWLVGHVGVEEPLFAICSPGYSNIVITPVYYNIDGERYSYTYSTSTSNSSYSLYISLYSNNLSVKCETFCDGTQAFNFFESTNSSVELKFILFKATVGESAYNIFLSFASSKFYISCIRDLNIGINGYASASYDYNILNQGTVFCRKYGESILNACFYIEGVHLPEIFKPYTNKFNKPVNTQINCNGRIYKVFNRISGTWLVDITQEIL